MNDKGLIIECPCGFGKPVYYINQHNMMIEKNAIYKGELIRYITQKKMRVYTCAVIAIRFKSLYFDVSPDIKDFNKTWFDDKEKAEARLREILANEK